MVHKRLPTLSVPARGECKPPRPALRVRDTGPFVRLFRALGDETRLEMIGLLAGAPEGELCVCDLEQHFALSQPTISHHLKVLREAGLLSSERRGTWVYYALVRGAFDGLSDFHALLKG